MSAEGPASELPQLLEMKTHGEYTIARPTSKAGVFAEFAR